MDRDAHCFIEPLKNNLSLSSLDLSHNEFADKGGVHLGAAIVSIKTIETSKKTIANIIKIYA